MPHLLPGVMTASVQRNAYRLADGLEPLRAGAGHFEIFAQVSFGWWDRLRNRFATPDPIVEVAWSEEPQETKLHLGGNSSPSRATELPLNLESFVHQIRTVPPSSAAGPMYVCLTLEVPDPDYRVVMNLPVRRIAVRVDRARERIVLDVTSARRAG